MENVCAFFGDVRQCRGACPHVRVRDFRSRAGSVTPANHLPTPGAAHHHPCCTPLGVKLMRKIPRRALFNKVCGFEVNNQLRRSGGDYLGTSSSEDRLKRLAQSACYTAQITFNVVLSCSINATIPRTLYLSELQFLLGTCSLLVAGNIYVLNMEKGQKHNRLVLVVCGTTDQIGMFWL
jgi:hypothetical protein